MIALFPEERTYSPLYSGGTCVYKQKTSRKEIVSRKVSNLFHSDKLEFVYMIPDTSLHQHNDVGVFDLDNLFCFQSDLFC